MRGEGGRRRGRGEVREGGGREEERKEGGRMGNGMKDDLEGVGRTEICATDVHMCYNTVLIGKFSR